MMLRLEVHLNTSIARSPVHLCAVNCEDRIEVYKPTKRSHPRHIFDAQRIAVRVAGRLSWLLSDHLGSTAVTADGATGARTAELWYKPWGESRGVPFGVTPTAHRFTGQVLDDVAGGSGTFGSRRNEGSEVHEARRRWPRRVSSWASLTFAISCSKRPLLQVRLHRPTRMVFSRSFWAGRDFATARRATSAWRCESMARYTTC